MKVYFFKFYFCIINAELSFRIYNGYSDCQHHLHKFFRTRISRCLNLLLSSMFQSLNKNTYLIFSPQITYNGNMLKKKFSIRTKLCDCPQASNLRSHLIHPSIQQNVLTAVIRNFPNELTSILKRKVVISNIFYS